MCIERAVGGSGVWATIRYTEHGKVDDLKISPSAIKLLFIVENAAYDQAR